MTPDSNTPKRPPRHEQVYAKYAELADRQGDWAALRVMAREIARLEEELFAARQAAFTEAAWAEPYLPLSRGREFS